MAASKAEVEISRATWLPNRSAFAKILVRNINTKPNKQTIIELTARCHEAAAKVLGRYHGPLYAPQTCRASWGALRKLICKQRPWSGCQFFGHYPTRQCSSQSKYTLVRHFEIRHEWQTEARVMAKPESGKGENWSENWTPGLSNFWPNQTWFTTRWIMLFSYKPLFGRSPSPSFYCIIRNKTRKRY